MTRTDFYSTHIAHSRDSDKATVEEDFHIGVADKAQTVACLIANQKGYDDLVITFADGAGTSCRAWSEKHFASIYVTLVESYP